MINTYSKIPRFVLNNNKISSNAKLLYGDLVLLCHKNGFCYATNKFLSSNMGLSTRTITRLLKQLKEENLIKISYSIFHVRNIYLIDNNVN